MITPIFDFNVLVNNIVESVGAVLNRTSRGVSTVQNRTYVSPSY
jgi:hypothetical protein